MLFSTVVEALADLRQGMKVLLVRDEEKPADGYLLAAAETAGAAEIAFMLRHGPGVLGLALTPDRLAVLAVLPTNFDRDAAPFAEAPLAPPAADGGGIELCLAAVRVFLDGCVGEARTELPEQMAPLRAAWGGVLACPTPVEAAVDLARAGGLAPVALICRLCDLGGARTTVQFAAAESLRVVSLDAVIEYVRTRSRVQLARLPEPVRLPTRYGTFQAHVYEDSVTGFQHMALVRGSLGNGGPVLARLHSECLTGDTFGSLRCDCGQQLDLALQRIADAGRGVFLYLRQEGRGIGLYNKLRTYRLQELGYDTVEANEHLGFAPDLRDYTIAAEILRSLGIREVRLLTNNPQKINSLEQFGVRVVERVPLIVSAQHENSFYLETKREKMNHLLKSEAAAALRRTAGRPVRFVIFAAPRTGSNWLCTLLDSHPQILCHHEVFNPERILYSLSCRDGRLDLGGIDERERDPLGFLDRLWQRSFGYPVLGFKLNRGQNDVAFRAVLADPQVRKIVIRRRNRIKTFVSEIIAERTGEWESYPGIEIGRHRPRVAVEVEKLLLHVELNQSYYRGIQQALAATGQPCLELTYEELVTVEERRRMLDFLGVEADAAPLQEATRKQNSPDLRDLIDNFHELGSRLRGTEFEAELVAVGL